MVLNHDLTLLLDEDGTTEEVMMIGVAEGDVVVTEEATEVQIVAIVEEVAAEIGEDRYGTKDY